MTRSGPSNFCPRCGYDLSGIRTPDSTKGTCSECGLDFSWAELDSGRLHMPGFSIEHAKGAILPPFLRTGARSVTGWRLWGPLKMEHEIRVGRLMLFVLLLPLLVHLAWMATMVVAARTNHLSGWWVASSWAATYTSRGTPTPPPPLPGAVVLWHDRGWPVTLADLEPVLVWPYRYQLSTGPWRTPIAALSLDAFIGCAAPMLGTPLVFLMLRQTRRQFRLRKLHLVRAVCLSGPAVLTTLLLATVIAVEGSDLFPWHWNSPNAPVLVTAGTACFVYQTFWWWTFARRYLKAPHSLGIAVSGVIIGGLLYVLASLVVRSNLLYGLLS